MRAAGARRFQHSRPERVGEQAGEAGPHQRVEAIRKTVDGLVEGDVKTHRQRNVALDAETRVALPVR
jgi:hypothetical protein